MGNNRNRNRVEVPGARAALDHLKTEVASELGIPNYDQLDLGALPSRLNGKVGGLMVRKMIEFAEHAMQGSSQVLQAVEAEPGATQEDIQVAQQSMQAANAFVQQFNQTGQLPQQQMQPADQQMQAMGQPMQAFGQQMQPATQQMQAMGQPMQAFGQQLQPGDQQMQAMGQLSQAFGQPLQAFNQQLQALNEQHPMPNPAQQQDAQAFPEGQMFQ